MIQTQLEHRVLIIFNYLTLIVRLHLVRHPKVLINLNLLKFRCPNYISTKLQLLINYDLLLIFEAKPSPGILLNHALLNTKHLSNTL